MFEAKIQRQIQQVIAPYQEQIHNLEQQLLQLKKRVKYLEQTLCKQQSTLQTGAKHTEHPTVVDEHTAEIKYNNNPTEELQSSTLCMLYMEAPTETGVFTKFAKKEQQGKSIYQLTTTDQLHANFILLNTPDAIATAMISVSQFIKPACKVIGNITVLPKTVQTQQEGRAILENGVWRITQKAIVLFE